MRPVKLTANVFIALDFRTRVDLANKEALERFRVRKLPRKLNFLNEGKKV
jgi:hypothetical protein